MDRRTWLAERRADGRGVRRGGAHVRRARVPGRGQRRFVARLLETCPPGGVVLDAPCGTGRTSRSSRPPVAGSSGSTSRPGCSPWRARRASRSRSSRSGSRSSVRRRLRRGHDDRRDGERRRPRTGRPSSRTSTARFARAATSTSRSRRSTSRERGRGVRRRSWRAGCRPSAARSSRATSAGYHYYPGRERVLGWIAARGPDRRRRGVRARARRRWGYRHFLLRAPAPRWILTAAIRIRTATRRRAPAGWRRAPRSGSIGKTPEEPSPWRSMSL